MSNLSNAAPARAKNRLSLLDPIKERVRIVAINELVAKSNNPRHSHPSLQKALRSNIRKHGGIIAPLLVRENGCLISGHARLDALASLGATHVPVFRCEEIGEPYLEYVRIANRCLTNPVGWRVAQVDNKLKRRFIVREMEFKVVAKEQHLWLDPTSPDPAKALGLRTTTSIFGDCWRLGYHYLECCHLCDIDVLKRLKSIYMSKWFVLWDAAGDGAKETQELLDKTEIGDVIACGDAGWGRTLLACERTGRILHGYDPDPVRLDCGIRAWQKLTGRDAICVETHRTFNDVTAERLAPPIALGRGYQEHGARDEQ